MNCQHESKSPDTVLETIWPIVSNGTIYKKDMEYVTCKECGPLYLRNSRDFVDFVQQSEKTNTEFTNINLHQHTKWSDGSMTIYDAAVEAKSIGMPALVVSDHDYMLMTDKSSCDSDITLVLTSPKRNADLGKEKYLKQCEEADLVSKELNYPIIVGIEASMYRCEEALLFGRDAILTFFDERGWLMSQAEDSIFELPKFRKLNHALIIVHPSVSGRNPNVELGLYKLADGYEVVNSHSLWKSDKIRKMRTLCPHGTPFFNLDSHSIRTMKYYCNPIHKSVVIKNEDNLIQWIKNRKVEWCY